MKPLYIFDLDGTLALIEHRRHFVERERGKQDWKGFYAACGNDEPNYPVIATMERLRRFADILIFSGRSDEVRALLVKYYGNDRDGQGLREPLHTVPTRDRFGLVTVEGADYAIADIGMRMLQPRELYSAQGFPADYIIDRGADGRALPKSAQVRMCGNSVCPPVAAALVRANFADAALRVAA